MKTVMEQVLLGAALLQASGCLAMPPGPLGPDVTLRTEKSPDCPAGGLKPVAVGRKPSPSVPQKKLESWLEANLRARGLDASPSGVGDAPAKMYVAAGSRTSREADIVMLPSTSSTLTVMNGGLAHSSTSTSLPVPIEKKVRTYDVYLLAGTADLGEIWRGVLSTYSEEFAYSPEAVGLVLDHYGEDHEGSDYSPARTAENLARKAEAEMLSSQNRVLVVVGLLAALGVGVLLANAEPAY